MGKRAILFPGQGAQKVGMGRDLYEAVPAARDVYDRANEILDIDLTRLCFEGPKDELSDTANCQAAILVTSIAALEALKAQRGDDAARADVTAGLSLGEYTALCYAGAIAFDDAVRLVRQRGLFMNEAGRQNPGSMVAVLGMDRDAVMELVAGVPEDKGLLVVANFNAPGQNVLSGTVDAIDWAAEVAAERGARRAIKLAVSGAFHSPLMESAAEKLKAELAGIEINDPVVPLVSNVSAKVVSSGEEARDLLALQLTSSVLWEDSMRSMAADGMAEATEVGPGSVLKGLLGKTDAGVAVSNVGALTDLE
jgi:[acyl-carrier-protein] S-malonyltransferase